LDTWFSSGLWPFSTLGWPEKTPELDVYYPTSTMVTGFDIIFFWVARMMMMGLRFMGDVPFRQVFINGLVRDESGHKMSKSRGNIIDPLEIIGQYGTDAVRFTLSVMAVPGADIPFSVNRMAGYRAFCNKIWNAARFLLMNLELTEPIDEFEIEALRKEGVLTLEDRWILSRLHQIIGNTNRDLERFNVHEASNSLYHFFWHELCDWYIELAKADVTSKQAGRGEVAQKVAAHVLETSLRLLHPFIPFITEELWQKVPHEGETIMLSHFPEVRQDWIDDNVSEQMGRLQELVTSVRTARAENNVDPKQRVEILLRCNNSSRIFLESQMHHLENLVRAEKIEFRNEFPSDKLQLHGVVSLCEYSINLEGLIDVEAEKNRLAKEMQRLQSEVQNLERKLANVAFLEKAPKEVVEKSQSRHDEVRGRIETIRQRLDSFSSA
jgi:valyl-tRNA synthetase